MPLQDADKFNLTEAGIGSEDGGGGCVLQRRLSEEHFRGGRSRVGDNHRLWSLARGRAEVGVVGGFPAIHNDNAIVFQRFQ